MSETTAEVAFPARCELGEGSLWDAAQNVLYWVDILDHKVFVFDPERRTNRAFDVGEDVGTVVVCDDERLLLALRDGFAYLDPRTGRLERLCDPDPEPQRRFNDGKCDPEGRFWAGTMAEGGRAGTAALYRIDGELRVERQLDGVTCSNGLAWSSDGQRFYYIDTPTQRIDRFDFEPQSGTLRDRRTAAEIPRELGAPDGMTIDAEDQLWVALFGGARVIRVDPSSGRIGYEVRLPVSNVTSCAFGGRELNELYITTARVGLAPEKLRREPLAGSLFRARLPFRGVVASRFRGRKKP